MKLVKNFLSLAAAEAISKLVTFAAFAYLARVAGPDGFGYVEFASAVMLCAGLVIDQGFGPYGAREIAKNPRRTPALVSEIVAARFILAIVAYAAIWAVALMVNFSPIVSRLLLLYGLSLLAMPLLLQWVFQGLDQMHVVGVTQVIRQTVFAALVFILVGRSQHIWLVAIAELAGVCSAAAYGLLMYWRRAGNPIRMRPKISGHLFREGVPIGLSQMFWLVKMYGTTLILGAIASPEDVGFFAAALRILMALHTFVYLYHFNLLPSLARSWQRTDGSFVSLINTSLRSVVWMGAAIVLIWVIVAPTAMRVVYGEAFEPAGSTLQWLAGMCLVAWLSGHYRFGLIASGHQTAEMITAAIGAIVAAILVPIGYGHRGPEGAAMALVIAEIAILASAWWLGRSRLGLTGHAQMLTRPLLAMILAAGLLRLLSLSWWGVRVLVAASAITTLALLLDPTVRKQFWHLRTVRRRDRQLVSEQLPEVMR